MPAATPRLYFQTLCQHEVFWVISTLNAGSLCSRHFNHDNTITVFFYFWEKTHEIVEILALLTTELSSYKKCNVRRCVILHSIGFNLH